jgi:putative flavoprotein involved in K+ transport
LPPGGVLVVGAGPSGQQIALELAHAGRPIVIAVGRHARAPRVYRGADLFRWLDRLGDLGQTVEEIADLEQARRSPSLPLLGSTTGEQLDLAVLRDAGVVLTGRLLELRGGTATFANDLAGSAADAERRLARLLDRIDDHIVQNRIEVAAGDPLPAVDTAGAPATLDLRTAGISSVVWATGYRRAYPWLHVPGVVEDGELVHRRGVTPVPGLFVLGLRFQWRRDSHFIGGVGRDAAHLAGLIVRPAETPARVDWRRIRIASYA